MSKTLWLRVGMTLELTDEQAHTILGDNRDGFSVELDNIVRDALAQGRLHLAGETYIPECSIEDYNQVNGTSYEVWPIETEIWKEN